MQTATSASEAGSGKLLTNFIFSRRWVYLFGVGTVILTDAMQVFGTRIVGYILDFFAGTQLPSWIPESERSEQLLWLVGILAASRVLLFFGRYGWRSSLARQSHRAGAELRRKVWDSVRYFSRDDLNRTYTKGVLMNASISDVQSARMIFGFTIVMLIDVIFLGIFTVGTMFSIHAGMTIWAMAIMLPLPIAIRWLSEREIDSYKRAQDYLGELNDLGSQVVGSIRLQRLTQTGVFWMRKLLLSSEKYRQSRLSAVKTSLFFFPLMGGASIISYIILFVLGIRLVLGGELSVGDFVSMLGLIFLLQDPLFELGFMISDWRKGRASLDRLAEVYNHQKEEHLLGEGTAVVDHPVVLELDRVSFTHPGAKSEVIESFDLRLHQGERLGITGPIGAGKSTLISLLAGLERRHKGNISFLGRPFSEYSHGELRNFIGHVPQKPFLFAQNIRQNIAVDSAMDDAEIWHYLKLAGIDLDVQAFPKGLDTPLGEWGINLSGGQKQRMTLARALAKKPRLLFLDDCLSAVDTVTEDRILNNLNTHLKGTTLVWVAHRKSTLKYCDRILELGGAQV
jgi:ATP-binding cassette subfamily B protein